MVQRKENFNVQSVTRHLRKTVACLDIRRHTQGNLGIIVRFVDEDLI